MYIAIVEDFSEPRPPPLQGHASVFDHHKSQMIVLGGKKASGCSQNTFDCYTFSPLQRQWKKLELGSHTISPRIGHTATLLPNRLILIFGGQSIKDEHILLGDAFVIDLNKETVSELSLSLVPRSFHTATYLNKQHAVLFAGGSRHYSTEENFLCLLRLDPMAIAPFFTSCDPIHPPNGLSQHTSVFMNEKELWIYGGVDENNVVNPNFFMLDLDSLFYTHVVPQNKLLASLQPAPFYSRPVAVAMNTTSLLLLVNFHYCTATPTFWKVFITTTGYWKNPTVKGSPVPPLYLSSLLV